MLKPVWGYTASYELYWFQIPLSPLILCLLAFLPFYLFDLVRELKNTSSVKQETRKGENKVVWFFFFFLFQLATGSACLNEGRNLRIVTKTDFILPVWFLMLLLLNNSCLLFQMSNNGNKVLQWFLRVILILFIIKIWAVTFWILTYLNKIIRKWSNYLQGLR